MKFEGAFQNERFWFKIMIFIGLSIFGMVVGVLISALAFDELESINAMRWSQSIISLTSFAFPALAVNYLVASPEEDFLRKHTYPSSHFAILGVVSMLTLLPLVNYLGWWNGQMHLPAALSFIEDAMRMMEDMAAEITEKFLAEQTWKDLIANIIFLALIPAVTEELFFRGALQRLMEKKFNVHVAIWLSAFIFSAYHMQFFGFVPRFLLGAFLGYLFVWGNSIYLPILAHFVNNANLVLFSFLMKNNLVSIDIDKVGVEQDWRMALLSLILTLPMLFFYGKKMEA